MTVLSFTLAKLRGMEAHARVLFTEPSVEQDRAVLDFEEAWFTSAVPKDQAIMERFGWSSAKYYQRLNVLLDDPAALEYKPLLVKRLRRMRAQRQAERSARRLR